jgi:hypothetical protein
MRESPNEGAVPLIPDMPDWLPELHQLSDKSPSTDIYRLSLTDTR